MVNGSKVARTARGIGSALVVAGVLVVAGQLIARGGNDRAEAARRWALDKGELAECVVPQLAGVEAALTSLDWASQAVFNLGRTQQAQEWSEQLLAMAEGHEDHWSYGNAIHAGHAMLGRIALLRGDRQRAKDHLLAAGLTPGSPQLNSFGPNVCLARDLLAAGETELVLAYLDQCEWFWARGHEKLAQWRMDIKQGQSPNFGANVAFW